MALPMTNARPTGRPWAAPTTGLTLRWVLTSDGLRMQWTHSIQHDEQGQKLTAR